MDIIETEKIYTIEDIYNLPDGESGELMDGNIYYMASPGRIHQKISMNLSYKIYNYINDNQGECEIYAAPFAVFLNNDNYNYVEPDISVICDSSKLDNKGCHGAPDWIIEIASPSSRQMDYFVKLFKYSSSGVREYWIVDFVQQCVIVYNFEKNTTENYSFGKDIPVGIYNGFFMKVES